MFVAAALVALLVIAAPASADAKTYHYSGKTDNGNTMAFSLTGNRMHNIDGYVTTTCVPTSGYPRTRPGSFNPSGSFRLGRTRKVSDTRYVSYWGDTTFHYKVSIKKKRGRTWTAKLHVNYGYVEYNALGGGYVDQTAWVCQGDDSFDFKR